MDTISSLYRPGAGGAKYKGVVQAIRDAITAGSLKAGDRLPPVRELAWALKITPGTVARAYTVLTEEAVLTAAVGRGTFVADRASAGPDVFSADTEWPMIEEEGGMVDLVSPKLPDVGQVALINDAFQQLARRPSFDLLRYPTRTSFEPVRRAVLRWLSGTPLGPIDQEDVVLCHGGQNGITLVMQAVLRGRRPVVLVEELSYPGFRRAAELLRAEVVTVPMDENGIIPSELERIARAHEAQLLCTSPEVQNPTGIVTPLERRQDIAQIARKTGIHILEDDCYRVAQSHSVCYRSLLPAQSWYVASISKSLTPALRVGFAVAPHERRSELRRAAEHGFFGLALPLAHVVTDLLTREDTYRVVDQVRLTLADHVRSAVNILGSYDVSWREDVPFIWLRLPPGWRTGAFCQAAENRGVRVRSSEDFTARDAHAPHAVRIAMNAQTTRAKFEEAVRCLRELLDNPPEQIAV